MDTRITTQPRTGVGRATSEKENSRCFNCHGLGHFSTECPKPQMLLCYNCREEGHKTFECTKNLSCRGCGTAGHKERQCPQNTTRSGTATGNVEVDSPGGGEPRRMVDEATDSTRVGDGLLSLPSQPPIWRGSSKKNKRQGLDSSSIISDYFPSSPPPAHDTFNDYLSQFHLNSLLDESPLSPAPSLHDTSNELPLPIPRTTSSLTPSPTLYPEAVRPSSPARSAPDFRAEEEELLKNHRMPRGSSLQRAQKAARHLSFAAGAPSVIDYVAEVDRLEPFRSRAGSSHTRLSASWVEDEDWDGATVSYDARQPGSMSCLEQLIRRVFPPKPRSPMDGLLPEDEMTIVTGTNSTQIAFSYPAKLEVGMGLNEMPNVFALKYRPSTNVVGRAIWLVNPALLFQAERDRIRSDFEDDLLPVPTRPPTLAVSAPLDNGSS